MNHTQAEDPEKKVEAAANTTLNRLIAGDFLESLGKELGLEVPPDVPFPETKASTTNKETFSAEKGERGPLPIRNKTSSADNARNLEVTPDKPHLPEDRLNSGGTVDFISHRNDSRAVITGCYGGDTNRNIPQKGQTVINTKSEASERHGWSSDSSGENRSRKRKHNRSDSSDSDLSDSFDDYRGEKSKREKNRSSRGDRSSSKRRHSKHHKHRRRGSPSRSSHHHSGKERGESRREKHKHK